MKGPTRSTRPPGVLTFTPVFGYSGTPAPVTYRVTDSSSQSSDAAYTPTVTAPALPAPPAKTSTGVGTTVQSVQLTAPTSGSVALLDGAGNPTNALTAPGVGTYVLDPATLVVSFAPAPGYHGTAAPITYQVVDAYGSTATATYTATVTAPAPPAAPAKTSTGPSGQVQQQQIAVPTGGTVTLLDAHGHPTTTVVVPGQGTYTLNPVTGVITFTPLAGFSGKAEPVTYQLTDAYGQSVTSAYTATVTKAKPTTPVGAPRLTAPDLVKSAGAVPVACSLTKGRTTACTVTAHTSVNGKRTQVGTGTTTLTGAAGKNGAFTVKVKITLTGLGRALAARPGGVRLVLTAAVRQAHVAGTRYTTGTTLVQAPTVRLRPVYFGTDSATARAVDRAYLLKVRALLANVTSVTCTGYTDARSTVRYNATLAKRRAQTACAILIGTKHIKVTTISRGEKRPDHTNNTKNGRALNRRAELILKY